MSLPLFKRNGRELFVEMGLGLAVVMPNGTIAANILGIAVTWNPDRTWTVTLVFLLARLTFGWVDQK